MLPRRNTQGNFEKIFDDPDLSFITDLSFVPSTHTDGSHSFATIANLAESVSEVTAM